MRILVIPDVHLKPEMFDEANYISKKFYDKGDKTMTYYVVNGMVFTSRAKALEAKN